MHVSFFGLIGIIFYTLVYMLQTLIFFICLLFIRDKSSNFLTIKINDLKYLLNSNKLLSYIFAINLFSMAGLPPLLGFFSKFYIFVILIQNNSIYTIILLIIMSCISTFYYVRIVQALFFNTNSKPKFYYNIPYYISVLLIILTIINIFFCCFSWLILDIINCEHYLFYLIIIIIYLIKLNLLIY
jgi:NADH-quinone oxidoreductase subunit N